MDGSRAWPPVAGRLGAQPKSLERSFHEDTERVGAIVGKGLTAFEASLFVESQGRMTSHPRPQAKHFNSGTICLGY
jgi:hypothetical protein